MNKFKLIFYITYSIINSNKLITVYVCYFFYILLGIVNSETYKLKIIGNTYIFY